MPCITREESGRGGREEEVGGENMASTFTVVFLGRDG
jgi:hypothetical protein